MKISASRAGWVQNTSLAEPIPYSAEVLDNFFPTAEGQRLRRGSALHATLASSAVVRLMTYSGAGTEKLFASQATSVYEITSPASATTAPTADLTGLTGGDWSFVQFGTSGGQYLWMCNGADSARHYDGTTWATPSITNVTSADLTQCWVFGSRIFAVEKDTLSAWYLPADSIAGAATELPLRSVFSQGGSLLFGSSWSIDSGEGIDDLCAFVTDNGEVAVYEGSDPSSASTWSLAGVYQIGQPLTKHGWYRSGGDLAIETEDGIVSLAQVVQGDRTAQSRSAISYPIETAWRNTVALRTDDYPFHLTLWPAQNMLFAPMPAGGDGQDQAFVMNHRTNAWCRYVGWDMRCSIVFDDRLFFGNASGQVCEAEVTGADDGAQYSAYWLPKFVDLAGGSITQLITARLVWAGNLALDPVMTGATNYRVNRPAAPGPAEDNDGSVWGAARWGSATWQDAFSRAGASEWQRVNGNGHAVSVWAATTSMRATAPEIDIIRMDLNAQAGRLA